MITPILSICIVSLEWRRPVLQTLLDELNAQNRWRRPINKVEILPPFIDSKEHTTGHKRQVMLEQATGAYVVSIDDDDSVPEYYIEEMVNACRSGADCIGITGSMTTDGLNPIEWRLSKDYDNITIQENGKSVYLRRTNHITAVKRENALAAGFNDISNGEDKYYSERLQLLTEVKIKKPMYHYRFSTQNKEY